MFLFSLDKMRIFTFLLILGFVFLALAPLVFAQTGDITIAANPATPQAYEEVTVRLESFSIDLSASDISWTLGNSTTDAEMGKTTFSFRAGGPGTISRVTASIKTPGGSRVTRSITINPAGVSLLWQGYSYTPPLYRGRALTPASGIFMVTAFPEIVVGGARVSDSNLIFRWEQDGTPLSSGSGAGKKNIVLKAPDVAKLNTRVGVTVSTRDGSVQVSAKAEIPAMEPYVLFYEKRSLLGLRYERALQRQMEVRTPDVIIRAEPYYFSLDNVRRDELKYTWSLDGQILEEDQSNRREIGFRSGEGGEVDLELSIRNTKRTLQSAFNTLSVVFGGASRFGI